jgi:uncharacterized glyoxalase superfamily protein PhnB
MIAAIVPQFFSGDLDRTLNYYRENLGFETQFEYGDPTFYAGAIRDGLSIFFRHVDQPLPWPANKYSDEMLDAYLRVENVDWLFNEISSTDTQIVRTLAGMPWGYTEFVVKDVDGRLLCFGQATELVAKGQT